MNEEDAEEIDMDQDLDDEGELDVEWYPIPEWLLRMSGELEEE